MVCVGTGAVSNCLKQGGIMVFNFSAWLRRFFGRSPRRARRPIRRGSTVRLTLEALEARWLPSGLQPGPTIFQPFVSGTTPVNTEGQTVLATENLLVFDDTDAPAATALAHMSATITWGDG